jgi:small subunit ribosomal protein S17e
LKNHVKHGGITLGKVKTEQVKRLGKELMKRYPEKFTVSFDENKLAVSALTKGSTTRIRNKVAGYITRTNHLAQADQEIETEEEIDASE